MKKNLKFSAAAFTVCALFAWLGISNWNLSSNSSALAEASLHSEIVKVTTGGFVPLEETVLSGNLEKENLGFDLFHDVRLSKNNQISCASCHNLNNYGVDGKSFSPGVNGVHGDANTPTVFNAQFNFRQFWDGRAADLPEQVEGPIHNPKEMSTNWPEIVEKLSQDELMKERIQHLYPQGISQESLVDALIAFEKTLKTPGSPFDLYLNGHLEALNESQLRGMKKFENLGCISCHQGMNIGGNMYQTLGLMGDYFKDRGGNYPSDAGRFNVTKNKDDLHVFRVPSLRNVEKTAPYFHDGSLPDLETAVRTMARYQLGLELETNDVSDLVNFLKSLTGPPPEFLKQHRDRKTAYETGH